MSGLFDIPEPEEPVKHEAVVEIPAAVTASVGTNTPPAVNAKIERNTKGYNWELTVVNAPSVDAAIDTLVAGNNRMIEEFNTK